MSAVSINPNSEHALKFVKRYTDLCADSTSWLSYHFAHLTPFGRNLLGALSDCEVRVPGLGYRFIDELHLVKYTPSQVDAAGWRARFEELIQKFAEILVGRALCLVEWPDDSIIEFEPLNKSSGKRPEFSVTTKEKTWLFEVKCPSFIAHQQARSTNKHQLPIRSFMRDAPHFEGETVTLPRDNTIKDFLKSAQEKFEGFAQGDVTGILVVVWDEHMYEAIGALCHPQAGLLTENSWFKKKDLAVTFPDISGVIVLNRLEQLKAGAQERADSIDPFQLGGPDALPNTWCPSSGVGDLDPSLSKSFDAFHFEGTAIGADYSMMDYVMWFEPPGAIAQRIARERRRRQRARLLKEGTSTVAIAASAFA